MKLVNMSSIVLEEDIWREKMSPADNGHSI